ncbi:MAG: DMT family transporter [bacterium]|nr:DMT family transporter [bacterium]
MIKIKNSLCIIAAGILWGIISVFVNCLADMGFTSLQIVAIRVFFSALIMVIYLLIADRDGLNIKIRDIPLFLGTGLGSIVLFNFCYFEAIEIIGGAAVPALLLYTAPIFVMLMSLPLFHERLTARKITALAVTLAGLILVTGASSSGGAVSLKAVILGLGSGFGYALYSIFGKFLAKKYGAATITAFTFITAAVFIVPFSGVISNVRLLLCPEGIWSVFGLSLLSTVIPFMLYTKGLKGTEAGKASILAAIEPFAAAVIGAVFFHETMDTEKIAGMCLIIFAIVILNIKFKNKF